MEVRREQQKKNKKIKINRRKEREIEGFEGTSNSKNENKLYE